MNKLAKIFLAVATMALSLVGCQEPVEEPQTTISIESTVVATPQGGTYTLDYTLENPVEGATLTATPPSVEWFGDILISKENIQLRVDSNLAMGATSREGTFLLNYNSKELAQVSVSQSALSGTFSFEITEITPESITVDIVASNDQITWMCNFAPKAYVEQNGGIEAYVITDAYAYINSYYGDLLDSYLFTGSTTKTLTMENPPLDEMYIWVAGVVRDNDEAHPPILATAPAVKEFSFIPYPTLALEAESAEQFSIAAGSHTFSYTLTNPIEGKAVTIELLEGAENWVLATDIDTTNSTITIEYAENTLAIERTGTIAVVYPYTETLYYYISQSANVQTEMVTFTLEVKELHYNRIVAGCTPSNEDVKYVVGAIAKKDFENSLYQSTSKIPEFDLSATYPTHTVNKGTQSEITLNNAALAYDEQWYVYAYAIDDAEKVATSEVKMELITLVDDTPHFVWDDERVVAGDYSNTLNVTKQEQTFTIKYSIGNALPTGVVTIEESYDDILIKTDGKRVTHDPEAQTITFTVSANTDGYKRTTYVYLKYFSSEEDTSSDANCSLKIVQSK